MSRRPILVMSAAAFFLLGGYEAVRSPSNTLFQHAYGADNFALLMSFLPLVLIAVVSVYNLVLSRFRPRRTLLIITVGSALSLLLCQMAIARGFAIATAVLYLVRETYVTLIIEQFWSYLNSVQKEQTAKRWNAVFMGMVSLGAMVGGLLVSRYASRIGTVNLPLFSVVATLLAGGLANYAFSITGEPKAEKRAPEEAKHSMGFSLFKSIPTLRYLFLLVACAQVVSTVMYLIFQKQLELELPSEDAQTAFSGMFYATLNAMSLAFQFVIAPFLLRYVPTRWVQVAIPVVHLTGIAAVVIKPGLATSAYAFAMFKSLDYSLFRASKEILYMPMPYDARYRAKEWIDVVGYRMAKGGTSGFIVALQRIGWGGYALYPTIITLACTSWLLVAKQLTKPKVEREPEPRLAL